MYGEGWNRRNYIFVVLGIICFLAAAGLLHTFKGRFGQDTAGKMTVNMMPVMEDTIDVSSSEQQPSSQAVNGDAAAPGTEKGEWVVYITGAVKNPGVYRVPEGARIYQALEAAGGFTADVDVDELFANACARVADGVNDAAPVRVAAVP